MKYWITFGFGLAVGLFLGAFFVAFVLLDDVTGSHGKSTAVVASAHVRPKAKKVETPPAVVEATAETKPAAVAAEALDLDSLPPADEGVNVIATAKREETPAAQPAPAAH